MAMLALAIGDDTISSKARRESIISGLYDLPSESGDLSLSVDIFHKFVYCLIYLSLQTKLEKY